MIHEYKRKGNITAVQFDGKNKTEIANFSGGDIKETDVSTLLRVERRAFILKQGTWVIKDEEGLIDSFSDNVFQQLFERMFDHE